MALLINECKNVFMVIPWDSISTAGLVGLIFLLAVAFSVSTVPIISVILLLLSEKEPVRKAIGFLVGHYAGILVISIGCYLLIQNMPTIEIQRSDSAASIILNILAGVALIAIAKKMWKNRFDTKTNKYSTKIFNSLKALTFANCMLVAFLLMVTSLKNWFLLYIVANALVAVDLGIATELFVLILFLIVSGITILLPVFISIIFGKDIQPSLIKFKKWLDKNSNTVLAIGAFLAGAFVLIEGISKILF